MTDKNEKEDKKAEDNYMSLGISFGLLVGAMVMTPLSIFGQSIWGGAAIGGCMMMGMLIGMQIKKK